MKMDGETGKYLFFRVDADTSGKLTEIFYQYAKYDYDDFNDRVEVSGTRVELMTRIHGHKSSIIISPNLEVKIMETSKQLFLSFANFVEAKKCRRLATRNARAATKIITRACMLYGKTFDIDSVLDDNVELEWTVDHKPNY